MKIAKNIFISFILSMKIYAHNPIVNTQNSNFVFKSTYVKPRLNADSFSFLDKYVKEGTASKKLIQDLKNYILSQKGKIKEADIKSVLGYGGLTTVFELNNDRVLKCSLENPLEHRSHCAEFDIPFLSPVEKSGEHFFVIEPKAEQEGITIEDCKDVIKRIYKAGYEPSSDLDEYKIRQVGRYNGKMYLLDTRAALPQPDRFSKFIYRFCNSINRVLIAEKVDPTNFEVKHIDETPRKNLGYVEGIKKAFDVIDTNVKHGCGNKFESFIIKYGLLVESVIQKFIGLFDKK
jgi:hypothetical protein